MQVTTARLTNADPYIEGTFTTTLQSNNLYKVDFSIGALPNPEATQGYFGFSISIGVEGRDSVQLKGNTPSTWAAGAYTYTFTDVPYGTNMWFVTNANMGNKQIPINYDQPIPDPPTPSNLSLSNASVNDDLQITFDWSIAGSYTNKEFQIDSNGFKSDSANGFITVDTNTYRTQPLSVGTHTIQMRANNCNTSGCSSWSNSNTLSIQVDYADFIYIIRPNSSAKRCPAYLLKNGKKIRLTKGNTKVLKQ